MKYVGHSYSRCVADIYEGRVNYDDVAVIIARTRFDPMNYEKWETGIWTGYTQYNGYSAPHWSEYEGNDDIKTALYEITVMLHKDGKLHQPRNFGVGSPWSSPYAWSKIETVGYDEMKKSDDEKWELPKKSDISNEDLKKLLGALI